MPKYEVVLTQTALEHSTVIVEADTQEAAEQQALDKANSGEVEWDFVEANDMIEVLDVTLVEEVAP